MSSKILLELVWWFVTAIIVGAVMYPIWNEVQEFPFWFENILCIILFVTYARYIFLLKHTFLANLEWLKIFFVLFSPMIVFYLGVQVNKFQVILDEQGIEYITKGVSDARVLKMATYIRTEYMFFAVATVVSGIIFTGRMIKSIWRKRNIGTV
jgi:hypothetical protein